MIRWFILVLVFALAVPAEAARTLHLCPDGTPPDVARRRGLVRVGHVLAYLRDGDRLILTRGRYGPLRFVNLADIRVIAQPGAVVDLRTGPKDWGKPVPNNGPVPQSGATPSLTPTPRGPQQGTDGLFLQNVRNYEAVGLTLQGASRNGLYIEGGQGVTLTNCRFLSNRLNGALLSEVSNLTVTGCEFALSRDGHGLYISTGGADGARITGSTFRGNGWCGLHGNPESGRDHDLKDLTVSGNRFEENGRTGNGAALSAPGWRDGRITENVFVDNRNHNEQAWFTVSGAGVSSTGNRITDNTFAGGVNQVQFASGSTGNTFTDNKTSTSFTVQGASGNTVADNGPTAPGASAGVPDVDPPAPARLQAAIRGKRVTLSWQAVPGARQYTIERGSGKVGPFTSAGTTSRTRYAEQPGLGQWWYRVAVTGSAQWAGPVAAKPR